jgi:hypothetical protein
LNADQVALENLAWEPVVQKILLHVAKVLGLVGRQFKAQLNKLLIYEKDGMFDRHKDSEKADGMFGTLVISLVSRIHVIPYLPALTLQALRARWWRGSR